MRLLSRFSKILMLLSVLALTACGGSSSNSGSGEPGATAAADIDAQSLPWPDGWIWKPRSEGTGTLVILPTGILGDARSMTMVNGAGEALSGVIRTGTHNNRSTIYFNRQGKDFPTPVYLKYREKYYKNGNPGARRN